MKNYLKIAYRQLLGQKMYAAIKIGGLSLGIATCFLIGLYIRGELGHDRSYPDADRIYRVQGDGQFDTGYDWPAPMSGAIGKDLPEAACTARIRRAGNLELRPAGQVQNTFEEGFVYTDQSFLDIFNLPIVSGDGRMALKEPQTMVISQSMADKYYHGQNAVGQVMYLDNNQAYPYRISAVMADIPANSHLAPFHFLLTLAGKDFGSQDQTWSWFNYWVYVKLRAGADVAAFEQKLNADLVQNYLLPQYREDGTRDAEQEVKKVHFHLQPVEDIHLYSYRWQDGFLRGDIRVIGLFGAIAIFILIIACVNFINLSTARSAKRAKEVGLRKVVGSYRSGLILQFLIESQLYSLFSFVMAMLIAWLVLPEFNSLASRSLTIPWSAWWMIPGLLIAALLVGTAAGLYPAFYLSAFNPALVLKGTIGSKSPVLRNALVVFQFAASLILIISTIVIYSQTQFMLNHEVGFDKEQVMVLKGTNTLSNTALDNFKSALCKLAAVKSASISDYLPIGGTSRNWNPCFKAGREKLDPALSAQFWRVDDTYRRTLGIKLLQGRDFSYQLADDTTDRTVLINQTLAKRLGLKDPVGAQISNGRVFTVIGLVQDFNFESMRSEIAPMVFRFKRSPSLMTVKLGSSDIKTTIAQISALWKQYAPDQPIRYTFLDQEFAAMYADVARTGRIFTSFAVLAIIIACLGLFALSAFMTEQRTKEIGIRKVLGASVLNVTAMLSKDFIKLVLVAILIAWPVAWWAMHVWLQDFAYQITISWWMFAAAGIGVILIALLTICFQSVKAALANPVKSLRSE